MSGESEVVFFESDDPEIAAAARTHEIEKAVSRIVIEVTENQSRITANSIANENGTATTSKACGVFRRSW